MLYRKGFVGKTGVLNERLYYFGIIIKAQGDILIFFHFVFNLQCDVLDKKGGIAVDVPVYLSGILAKGKKGQEQGSE